MTSARAAALCEPTGHDALRGWILVNETLRTTLSWSGLSPAGGVMWGAWGDSPFRGWLVGEGGEHMRVGSFRL